MSTRRQHSRTAFTLIELMIASVIFVTVMASLIGFLSSAVENISYITQEARKGRDGPAIVELMTRDLSNAFVDPRLEEFFSLEDGENNPQLHFVTSLNSTLFVNGKQSDVVETGYWLERNELGAGSTRQWYTLFRREDYGLDEEPLRGGKAIPIASNVTEFKVLAYDYPVDEEGVPLEDVLLEELRLGKGGELEERTSWDTKAGGEGHANSERRLPYALRIQITFDIREGGELENPDAERDGLITYVTTIVLPPFGLKIEDRTELNDSDTGQFAQIKLNTAPAAPVTPEPPAAGENGNNANNGNSGDSGDNGNSGG